MVTIKNDEWERGGGDKRWSEVNDRHKLIEIYLRLTKIRQTIAHRCPVYWKRLARDMIDETSEYQNRNGQKTTDNNIDNNVEIIKWLWW